MYNVEKFRANSSSQRHPVSPNPTFPAIFRLSDYHTIQFYLCPIYPYANQSSICVPGPRISGPLDTHRVLFFSGSTYTGGIWFQVAYHKVVKLFRENGHPCACKGDPSFLTRNPLQIPNSLLYRRAIRLRTTKEKIINQVG